MNKLKRILSTLRRKYLPLILVSLITLICASGAMVWLFINQSSKYISRPQSLALEAMMPTPDLLPTLTSIPNTSALPAQSPVLTPMPLPTLTITSTQTSTSTQTLTDTLTLSQTATPASILTTTSTQTMTNSTILWSADMETGNFSQWYLPDKVGGPNTGGGMYNKGNGSATVTSKIAHKGNYSAELTISNYKEVSQAARLFRWEENPREAYYTVWYYFPQNYKPVVYWNVLQFLDPMGTTWVLNVGNRTEGKMYFYLYDAQNRESYDQSDVDILTGQWTKIEVFYSRAITKTGRITVWQDGTLLFDLGGVQTSTSNQILMSVNNFSDSISPSPATIYIDDISISTERLEQ